MPQCKAKTKTGADVCIKPRKAHIAHNIAEEKEARRVCLIVEDTYLLITNL